jgi:hypothetical protein
MTRQIPLEQWPHGLEEDALLLTLMPEEISRRSKIVFESDHDSLDDFQGALIEFGRGKAFALQHHLNAPVPGTTVLLETGSVTALKVVISFLKLRRDEISWAAPGLEPQVDAVFRARQLKQVGLAAGAALATGLGVAALKRRARRTKRGNGKKSGAA